MTRSASSMSPESFSQQDAESNVSGDLPRPEWREGRPVPAGRSGVIRIFGPSIAQRDLARLASRRFSAPLAVVGSDRPSSTERCVSATVYSLSFIGDVNNAADVCKLVHDRPELPVPERPWPGARHQATWPVRQVVARISPGRPGDQGDTRGTASGIPLPGRGRRVLRPFRLALTEHG